MITRLYGAAFAVALLLGASPAGAIDNLSCFKVDPGSPKARFPVVLGGPLSPKTCTLKAPAKTACIATEGTSITPTPGDQGTPVTQNFLCYQAKCAPGSPGSAEFTDMLGQHQVTLRGSRLICLPAGMTGGITPGTTTTTLFGATTTTTMPVGQCHFSDGRCQGTCAAGSRCGTVVGTADCECRSVSCGDADAPECDGACSSSGEACVFDLTGCSCVRVP